MSKEEDLFQYILKLREKDPSITDAEAEKMFEEQMLTKKKKSKKTVKVKGGGMIRKFASGGAALRGFGKVIK